MAWSWPFPQTDETHGGYPLMAIVLVRGEQAEVFKTHLQSDFALRLAKSVWANNQPIDELWIVNMKTGNRRDIFSRPAKDGA